MGFFKSITRFFNQPTKSIASVARTVINNPIRAIQAVGTYGLSEAVRATPIIGKPFQQAQQIASDIYKPIYRGAAGFYTGGLSEIAFGAAQNILTPKEQQPMAFNVGQLLGGIGQAFGNSSNPYFQGISAAGEIGGSIFTSLAKRPGIGSVPMIPSIPMPIGPVVRRVGSSIGRSFFNKFPSLATAMQQLRDRGQKVKRTQLWSMLKRFGPEVLVSGGLLTAAAVNELMVAGPGRRRMNPANVHALRRSMRRLESFHKICVQADRLRKPKSRSGKVCKTR